MRNHNVEKLEFIVIFRISALFWTFWAHCQYKCSSSSGVRVLTILMFICQQFWLENTYTNRTFHRMAPLLIVLNLAPVESRSVIRTSLKNKLISRYTSPHSNEGISSNFIYILKVVCDASLFNWEKVTDSFVNTFICLAI